MIYRLETDYGSISLDKAVIVKIITEAINYFDGRVMLSNHRGKVSSLATKFSGTDDSSYLDINLDDQSLNLKIFIVIKLGTSIKRVANQLIDTIKKNIAEMIGIESTTIAIVVTGIASKQVAKRNILIKG